MIAEHKGCPSFDIDLVNVGSEARFFIWLAI